MTFLATVERLRASPEEGTAQGRNERIIVGRVRAHVKQKTKSLFSSFLRTFLPGAKSREHDARSITFAQPAEINKKLELSSKNLAQPASSPGGRVLQLGHLMWKRGQR
jgi:hypothetical protein